MEFEKVENKKLISPTFMFLPIIPMLYTTTDFLIDQKEQIEKLEKQLKKTPNENRRALIKSQIAIYYQEGLEVLARFEHDIPKSTKDYFMGYRKDKPSFWEIVGGGVEVPSECPRCHSKMKEVPAGVSKKTGRPFRRFWACENLECDFTYNERKKRKNRFKQDQDLAYISIAIALGILTVLYFFWF